MKITLVGMGMGDPGTLTAAAREALAAADAVIGSERLLATLPAECAGVRVAQAIPEKIAAVIANSTEWRSVCVALSGDVGFYSGAKRLLDLLEAYDPALICGISTPQYFAAKLRRPWQDFRLVSAHGLPCDVLAEVLNHPTVMFLTGGECVPGTIMGTLCEAGLSAAAVTVGENLSSPRERIRSGTAAELLGCSFAPLSVVLVENGQTFARDRHAAGMADSAFIRGNVPMTKREVRACILSLLAPAPDAILYDVGAGTGSVAVEMALLARRGRVFAIERSADGCALIEANRERFGAYNLRLVHGFAPEALEPLPPPDAAFIGGSQGMLPGIIDALLQKNRRVKIVVSAITLETLSAAMDALRTLEVDNIQVRQIATARATVRGRHHLLEAQNPVFLIDGGGDADA